ncbi:hypothetical protein AB4156_38435 [Cupriavidus sp. 2MCAB6]|uniref:hypothetical protein n=1 Tax=Cupriavidus sp. 2MCAB6 TaxID=3232981 RepID=UPI000A5A378C
MRLLYLVYGIIVLFGTTFFNIGDTGRSGSSSGYSSARGWSGGSSGSSGWSSGGGHK